MLVDVARLFEALQRVAWKHGMVRPELFKHTVHEDGSHTISLTLAANDVRWERPKHLERPGFGASTPAGADGKKR
jgi:hypothetical protein